MHREPQSLFENLQSTDVEARRAAAQACANLVDPPPGAAELLAECVGDPDEAVRQWAAEALEKIGAPANEQILPLAAMLSHRSPDVAYWAATLLGRAGPHAAPAAESLGATLAAAEHLHVQERCAWALGEIGPAARNQAAALKAATQAAQPRLRRLAASALEAVLGPP